MKHITDDVMEMMALEALEERLEERLEETKEEKNPRTRKFRRRQRALHILKKESIMKGYRPDNMPKAVDSSDLFYFEKSGKLPNHVGDCAASSRFIARKFPGELAKNKLHCSCPMCTFKGITQQDRRAIDNMISDVEESEDVNRSFIAALKKEKKKG